jgi:hypothetical protein
MSLPYFRTPSSRYVRRTLASIAALGLALGAAVGGSTSSAAQTTAAAMGDHGSTSKKSSPPDRDKKVRKVTTSDLKPMGSGSAALLPEPGAFVRDPIVSNTNVNLTNTDTAGDGEPSIAVNPANRNEIVIASFNGGGFYRTTDGGTTWTFVNSYSQPPGAGNIPNDQQIDFTRGGVLAGTFLGGGNIETGTTANAASQAAWNWPLDGAGNTVLTNAATATSIGNADQPWIVTAPQPAALAQDNIFVAYDDFGVTPTGMHVTSANAANPPTMINDTLVGTAAGCCGNNPGLRMAADSRTGFVYALWQTTTGPNADQSSNADIHLNRSVDGGVTWTLNGSATGVVVASGASNQRTPKFGTVNALIGGVHHAAVDPVTGDVYVVYACGDGIGGDNPLCVRRLHDDGSGTGTMTIDAAHTITTLHSALPSIAVATNRVIGVLFQSFDGFSSDGFPIFSAHLSVSDDQGATWTDRVLETSLSPVNDSCLPLPGPANCNRQRLLGDYQEIVAVGRTFYGTFTGNGAPFGRTVSNMDPIFFKSFAGGPAIAVSGDLAFGTVARGTTATRNVVVQNVGTDPLVVNSVTLAAGSDAAFSVVGNPTFPATIQPGGDVTYQVRFSPPAGSSATPRAGTLVIQSNDPDTPTVNLAASGTPGTPVAVVAASNLLFGDVPVDDRTAPSTSSILLRLSNQASCQQCDLTLTQLTIGGTNAGDFTVVGAPSLPATIAAGNHLDLTVVFNPSFSGSRTGTLTVDTDDPATASQVVTLQGNGLVSGLGVLPDPVIFGPTVATPACGVVCGTTQNVRVTNTGQAELIVDVLSFFNPASNPAAFSGPGATTPPRRVAVNGFFDEPVTFRPAGAPDRSVDGTFTVQHLVGGANPSITVEKNVPMCGEATGRGIRVLVVKRDGTIQPTVGRLTLQSFGTKRKVAVDERNLALTTISPPVSCQTLNFHYENQDLPEAESTGKKSAYYTLKVTVGNLSTTQTIHLAVDEFKTIVVTVGT